MSRLPCGAFAPAVRGILSCLNGSPSRTGRRSGHLILTRETFAADQCIEGVSRKRSLVEEVDMPKIHPTLLVAGALVCLASTVCIPAEARGFHGRNTTGAAGGWAHRGQYGQSAGIGGRRFGRGAAGAAGGRWSGPNGGNTQAAGGGIAGRQAGLIGGGFSGQGPLGGTGQGAGAAGWRKGVGAFEHTGSQFKGPNGSTYAGSTNGKYNAQTGQGSFDSSKQAYDAKNGKNYGYDASTQYQKGQGADTTIDTQNHGDYSVDWDKGSKPVVQHSN